MSAYDRLRNTLSAAGKIVKDRSAGSFVAQCPAHDDHNPSLSVTAIEGSVLLHCHAGCQNIQVLDAVGLTVADLYDNPRGAEYPYPGGRLVRRTPGKSFPQSGNKSDRSLFRADRLTDAVTEVLVVEGEKDVLAAEAVGAVAVCSAMGAGKAHLADWSPLAGRKVTVVADDDDPGRRHAAQVVDQLSAVGVAEVRVVRAAVGKDLADHVAADRTLDDLIAVDIDGGAVFDFIDGGRFIFDQPDTIPAIWGRDSAVLWAEGESLMIAGPPGLGKTTLAGQLIRARLGIGDGHVLGLPVTDTGGVILYLAMDRPRQIARSLARQFRGDDERQVCADRLKVWQGPPPADIAQNPGLLLKLAQEAGADTVVVDSVKDAATGLSNDEVGAGYNRARQMLVAAGIEVLELHHTVKRGANGGAPTAAADIYGSAWIVNGTGSVILLSGEPGDAVIGFHHIRQPAEEVGPWQVHHDQIAGRIRISESLDVVGFVADCGPDGATADDLVEVQHPGKNWENSRERNNAREKARRLLEKLVGAGKLQRADGTKGGVSGGSATVYFLASVDDGGDVSDDGESDHAAITLFGKPQVKRSRAEPITEPVTHRSRGSRDYEKPQVKRSRERSRGKSEAAITQPTVPLGTGVREPGGHQNGKPHRDTAATPSPAPADDAANDAYINGLCRDCRAVPYSPGRTRCDSCHHIHQRVMAGYDR